MVRKNRVKRARVSKRNGFGTLFERTNDIIMTDKAKDIVQIFFSIKIITDCNIFNIILYIVLIIFFY